MNSAEAPDAVHAGDDALVALRDLPSHLRFWLPAVVVLWLDLWSKAWAFSTLPSDRARSWIDGFVEFRRSLNDGAVFGSFTGYVGVFIVASFLALGFVFYLFARSHRWHRSLHVALAMILAGALGNLYDRGFIVADVAQISTADGQQRSLIGVVLDDSTEGIVRMGDWPDGANPRTLRSDKITLRRQGVVRDFIKIVPRFPRWVPRLGGRDVWPWVFNVADASLVCGVGLLLITGWIDRRPRA